MTRSVGCHRSFWLKGFCFTNFAVFVVIISLHVLNPIATSSDEQLTANMRSEESIVTPNNEDTDQANAEADENGFEEIPVKSTGEEADREDVSQAYSGNEKDKSESTRSEEKSSNGDVTAGVSSDEGNSEPNLDSKLEGTDQNIENGAPTDETLNSNDESLTDSGQTEKSGNVENADDSEAPLDDRPQKGSEGIELKESLDSSASSSTTEGSTEDLKKESEKTVASDDSAKLPSQGAHQQDSPPVERKLQDSRSLINDLLQDSNIAGAGQGNQVTDSNVQEPRVISNSSRVVNGSVVINETVDQKVEKETEKEDMFTFQEWKEQKLMEEQLSKEAAAASAQGAANGAASGGASGSEQGSGNPNQASNGINGNAAGGNGHAGASGSNGGVGGGSSFKVQQYTQNFASADCGAKVLDAPASSQGRDAILHSDRDKYLNFPCDEPKKYFVIELCEPIQLKVLDIGCYELFSSLLANFTVHGSDRYPSREWKLLGNFTAKNERTLQSYNFADQMYYKYIRVEYLSHYGKEHYCPVSSVRAFGLTIEVEDEEQLLGEVGQNSDQESLEPDQVQQTSEDTKNMNVLSTVTDAMAKIANKIIGTRSTATEEAKSVNDSMSSQKEDLDSTEKLQNTGSTFPEVPRPQTDANYSDFGSPEIPTGGSFNMNPPVILTPNLSVNTLHNSSDLSNVFLVNMSLAYPDFLPMYVCDEDLLVLLTCPLYQYLFAMKGLNSQCCIVTIKEEPADVKLPEVDGKRSETGTKIGNEEGGKRIIESSNSAAPEILPTEGVNANVAANVNENNHGGSASPTVVEDPANHHVSSGAANGGGGSGNIVQKESLLVRLRNKVRELEFNMSLSSDYLEQLSRRYKKQMDEITAKHNKTLTALISTNEEAASRDVKHSQKILELEGDVIRLTNRVVQLEESMTNMTDTLVLQHMMFISVEFAVFALFIFLYIIRSCRSVTNHSYNRTNKRSRSLDDTITNERITSSSSEGRGSESLTTSRRGEDSNDGRLGYCEELMPSIEDLVVPQATPFRTKQTGQNKNMRHMKQNGTAVHAPKTLHTSIPPRPFSSASADSASTSTDGFSTVGKKKRRSKSGVSNNNNSSSSNNLSYGNNSNSNQKYLTVERSPSSSSSVASSASANMDNRTSNIWRTSPTTPVGDSHRPNYLSVI
ncbi:uncharacterized protein LOC142337474 isoform X2 [Convolutriloba macropyga]